MVDLEFVELFPLLLTLGPPRPAELAGVREVRAGVVPLPLGPPRPAELAGVREVRAGVVPRHFAHLRRPHVRLVRLHVPARRGPAHRAQTDAIVHGCRSKQLASVRGRK